MLTAPIVPTAVAPGVMRLGTRLLNWYVIEEDGRLTVVDAGLPCYRPQLTRALATLGRSLADIEAVILTHAHADHVGLAERLRREAGARVYVHEGDARLAGSLSPFGPSERTILPYLRHPRAPLRLLGHIAACGGLRPRPIERFRTFTDGEVLEVPGRPRAIATPGHTAGHTAFHFERHDVLLAGDAICTLNPLTGTPGPQVLPAAFSVSTAEELASVGRLEESGAAVLLPGHGEPWTDGVAAAVHRARMVGPT